jgi:hypothetical protein
VSTEVIQKSFNAGVRRREKSSKTLEHAECGSSWLAISLVVLEILKMWKSNLRSADLTWVGLSHEEVCRGNTECVSSPRPIDYLCVRDLAR